ncbi:hypothetical protein [Egicoccus halophilus]|uniref:Polyketide cyclase / dehydrase and lipid transport n=1 Tax=Egicoccus halophilus TaxID=1670830 RepID=A0A8J3EU42_9ACTN|nr:hypothetical protein [Egicoccus halophilus]GGI06370.1 hypothetical protein GCM10011354_18750 [Egicoccus halophilus]
MSAVTRRCHVCIPARDLWARLVDVEGLVVEDHELDLVELDGSGALEPGARMVLSRRQGQRLTTYDVHVLDVVEQELLRLSVETGRDAWLVEARLRRNAEGTAMSVTADLDPSRTPQAVLHGLTRPLDLGLYTAIDDLLDRWVHRACQALAAAT